MLPYPAPTTRAEKFDMIKTITDKLLAVHGSNVLAIGAYGSTALGTEGTFSDIEMHVITTDGIKLDNQEFIYGKFKIELTTNEKRLFIEEAKQVDDSWAITAGAFIHILPLHDPEKLFDRVKKLPLELTDAEIRRVMKEFMIWEPYETVAKLRNNHRSGNWNYIVVGANDLAWQTAKLIGLANRRYYSTRARTFEESLDMPSIPKGYRELVELIMSGELQDKESLYMLSEDLWSGLNSWYSEMKIDYRSTELPI